MTTPSPPPAPAPRVIRLRPKGSERIVVELDDDRTFGIAAEVALDMGLRAGDPIDAALEARLLDSDLRVRAREAALTLLAVRARSRKELEGRLRRKSFPKTVIDPCLDRLEADGWLDDAAFARILVRDRLRLRPRGPGRMAQELRSKGVSDAVARDAVDEVFAEEEVSVPELAAEVARGWLRRQPSSVADGLLSETFTPERQKAARRLYSFLSRRGFSGGVAREALESLRRKGNEGDDSGRGE